MTKIKGEKLQIIGSLFIEVVEKREKGEKERGRQRRPERKNWNYSKTTRLLHMQINQNFSHVHSKLQSKLIAKFQFFPLMLPTPKTLDHISYYQVYVHILFSSLKFS